MIEAVQTPPNAFTEVPARPVPARIYTPDQDWTDRRAYEITKADFQAAAQYRQNNHDWRWDAADRAYTAWATRRNWEGTNIPRASISVFAVLQQIEALVPRVTSAAFSAIDWFEAIPMGNMTAKGARNVRNIMLAQLEGSNVHEQGRRLIKSAATYGNGIWELSWLYQEKERQIYVPEFIPEREDTRVLLALTGQTFPVPNGRVRRRLTKRIETVVENRPVVSYVPLRDFYVNPHCPSPDPKEAGWVCRRSYMTPLELIQLRGVEGFTIPSNNKLGWMTTVKQHQAADKGRRNQEAGRGANYDPSNDYTSDLARGRIEVIRRVSAERTVWIVPGVDYPDGLLYNGPNPFGFINYYGLWFADLLDRFYAIGIADIGEPEQRLQEGLLRGRLDEIALTLYPHTVRKPGAYNQSRSAYNYRPGGVSVSDDPKNDIIRQFPPNITQTAMQEQILSDLRFQKQSGVTDLSSSGAPNATNPAARSATGASAQVEAAFSRQRHIVDNLQASVLEPLLNDVFQLNKRHLDPNQKIDSLEGTELDPAVIWAGNVKFRMRGASRVAAKTTLVQYLPLMLQYMLNPAYIQQLTQMGKTPDFDELFKMLQDATGYDKHAGLIRDLTPEEQQALQAQAQQEQDPKLVLQRERLEELNKMALDKNDADLSRELIRAIVKMRGDESTASQAILQGLSGIGGRR